jgi:hypothetical protein
MNNAESTVRHTKNLNVTLFILLTLLMLLNFGGFMIYRYSHSSEAVTIQLWNYLASDLFEIITISLLLPIIVLVLESHFRFIQSLLENQLEREEAIKVERRALEQQRRQVRTEKRLEAILSTQKMMNQLFDLAAQVRHFRVDVVEKKQLENEKRSKTKSALKIGEIRKAIGAFSVVGNDTINMWSFRLKLSSDDEEIFVYFINIVEECSDNVAQYINETKDGEEIAELQRALEIIWTQIKRVAHQDMISILKLHFDLLELKEDSASQDKLEKVNSEICTHRASLKVWHQLVKTAEQSSHDFLPEICGDETNALQGAMRKAMKYLKDHPENDLNQYDKLQDLERLYYTIPRKSRFLVLGKRFSKEFIKNIAESLGYQKLMHTLFMRSR